MPDVPALKDLSRVDGVSVASDVTLSRYTTVGTGGPAALLAEAGGTAAISETLAIASRYGLPWFILGQGSNLLVDDNGWDGLVIRMGGALKECALVGESLDCGGGASLPVAARQAAAAGLSGLEPLSGIPGTIGGAVAMNAGAFGAWISELVDKVQLATADGSRWVAAGELEFGYRSCRLPAQAVICRVLLALEPGEPELVSRNTREFRKKRQESQPGGVKTFGSVFRNPPGHASAGELLDRAGCKGLSRGGAVVSDIHANFIINQGGASSSDIVNLMNECRAKVHERFGMVLEPEVRMLGDLQLEVLS